MRFIKIIVSDIGVVGASEDFKALSVEELINIVKAEDVHAIAFEGGRVQPVSVSAGRIPSCTSSLVATRTL